MGKFVQPKVYLIGYSQVYAEEMLRYLTQTGQTEFANDVKDARNEGLSYGEIMTSMFAKLCYKSLALGYNSNVSKTRSIRKNLESCFDTGHGSVFEHFQLNFLITDCSRVFTHELVRHRAGTAFSQTSGRYCRLDSIDLVLDPILEPIKDYLENTIKQIEDAVYMMECKLGLRKPPNMSNEEEQKLVSSYASLGLKNTSMRWIPDDSLDFEKRKKLTSAIRRIAPNGQSNEIAFSCNIRALRHIIQLRTSRHAEWEVRNVFNQVFDIVKEKYPLMLYRARTKEYDGLKEVYGMKSNPYELDPSDPKCIENYFANDLV